ncbi:hypothetical protein MHH81_01855 [Psychrobacillus sp. FSL H8-0484]|uniref:hypothetical protein n=1 Tax=Psychrobacillus sp. FSL H8-0484 TaxID=2921390 RepID=UPI0030F67A69
MQTKALVEDGAAARPDGKVEYSPSRAHLIFGMHNSVMSILGPYLTMSGPLCLQCQ